MELEGRYPRRPEVSVVVPVRDAAPTLDACLQSLCAQTLTPERYEVIVVDNNSRDGSPEIVRSTPGVTCLSEVQQGAYAARNRGLRAARSRVVAFTDPDCVPDRDWLEAVLAALTNGAVVAVGQTLPLCGSRSLELLVTALRIRDEYVFAGSDTELYYGRTNNMAVLRSVFDELGPFAELSRGADTLLVRTVLARYGADACRFDPRMQVRHAELGDVGDHLRKMHVYGYSHHRLRQIAPVRPLRIPEWRRLLPELTRNVRRRSTALPTLLVLMVASRASWRLGEWRAAARLAPPRGMAPTQPSA